MQKLAEPPSHPQPKARPASGGLLPPPATAPTGSMTSQKPVRLNPALKSLPSVAPREHIAETVLVKRLNAQQTARDQQQKVDTAKIERRMRRRERRERRAQKLAAAEGLTGFGTEAVELLLGIAGAVVCACFASFWLRISRFLLCELRVIVVSACR
eukprot:SAG31_NODE_1411_length_8466_cov_18.216565_3_plen_156_part_00